MEIYLFGVRNGKMNLKELPKDYAYMFGDGEWKLLLIFSGILGLMWGMTYVVNIYLNNIGHGVISMLLGLATMISSAIYIYWILIPVWVRFLIPLIIILLNCIILPIAFIQKFLDFISETIVEKNLDK
jgi:hypothetical protein